MNQAPAFTGITTYQDPSGRFSFRHPWDWTPDGLDEGRDGVLLLPEEGDARTYFAVWAERLPISVTAEDLPELSHAFDDSASSLPDAHVTDRSDETFGNIVRLDRLLTFSDAGSRIQRHVWALYAGDLQVVVIYQASSPRKYEYWLSMGNYCFATFTLPDATWHATDPELGVP